MRDYQVRLYTNIPQTKEAFLALPEKIEDLKISSNTWKCPCINVTGLNFGAEKIYQGEGNSSGTQYSINVLPKTFYSSFYKKIQTLEQFLIFKSPYYNHVKSYSLYNGSYENSLKVFNNEAQLKELISKAKLTDSHNWATAEPYSNEDYFNAMTDGQLGDYNDFNGDLDDIDTWSTG